MPFLSAKITWGKQLASVTNAAVKVVSLPKNGLISSLLAKTDFLTERTLGFDQVVDCEMYISLIDSDCKRYKYQTSNYLQWISIKKKKSKHKEPHWINKRIFLQWCKSER